MYEILVSIPGTLLYQSLILFLAAFPITIAALAINSSREFYLTRMLKETENLNPHANELQKARAKWKLITIIIPARNEAENLKKTIEASLNIDWPDLEIIIVNDGSTDKTCEIVNEYKHDLRVKYLKNGKAQGKSKALNKGIFEAKGELILILDADAIPGSNVLNRMAARLIMHDDIAAVTGNPRVARLPNLLTKIQAIEFSSTISTLRRGQGAWGRINTVSGIMTLFHKNILIEQGGFSKTQPTEDIELTWRLHAKGYRCVYEPSAQVGMIVPQNLTQWLRQRLRWSSGLVKVLQTHSVSIVRNKQWNMAAILSEALLAIIWCHILVVMTILWLIGLMYGLTFLGNPLIVGQFGAITISVALLQILWGMKLDSSHDKNIYKLWILAPLYPIAYWWLSAVVVVISTVPTLMKSSKNVTWESPR
jgi:biofilm PGA synthesis N-glycosyltransferase PgaC